MTKEEKREHEFLKWCHAQKAFVVRDDSENTFYAGYDAAAERLQSAEAIANGSANAIRSIAEELEQLKDKNARLRKCLSEMLHYYEEQIGMEGEWAGCDDEKRVLNVARKLLKQ